MTKKTTINLPPIRDEATSAEKLKLLADNVPALIAYFRTQDMICDFCNIAYAKAYGLTPETAVGRTVPDIIGKDAYANIKPYVDRVKRGETVSYQRPLTTPDGQARIIEVNLIPHSLDGAPSDEPNAAFVLINDITKFKKIEDAIRESEERLQKFADATIEALVFHEHGIIVDANEACARLLRLPVEKIIGHAVLDFVALEGRETVSANIRASFEDSYESVVLRADGTTTPVEFIGKEMRYGNKMMRMTVVRDISARKEAEARIQFLAHHDMLTHLPNRALLMDRLQVMLAAAKRQQTQVAVLFIDLDNFKTVNDSMGHHAGDELLKCMASRLQSCLRVSDIVGRLGGDEFLVVLTNLAAPEDAVPLAEKLAAMISEPFLLKEKPISVSGSIGISVFPKDGDSAENLIQHADAAMYFAKDCGRNNVQFFSSIQQRT